MGKGWPLLLHWDSCAGKSLRSWQCFLEAAQKPVLEQTQFVNLAKEACLPEQCCVWTTGSRDASRKQALLPLMPQEWSPSYMCAPETRTRWLRSIIKVRIALGYIRGGCASPATVHSQRQGGCASIATAWGSLDLLSARRRQ